jgi:transcriptional regulator with XRE-family HTH domain
MDRQSLAAYFLEARHRKELTQTELSALLGLPQSYISQVEQGKHDIKTSTLSAWARVLDLEVMLIPRHQVPAVSYLIQPRSSDQQPIPPAYGPLPDVVQ